MSHPINGQRLVPILVANRRTVIHTPIPWLGLFLVDFLGESLEIMLVQEVILLNEYFFAYQPYNTSWWLRLNQPMFQQKNMQSVKLEHHFFPSMNSGWKIKKKH